MVITCEGCSTRFQLDDARVPAQGIRVRCSRCKHAFLAKPPQAAERFFPELVEANGDPRAELLFADGVKWVDDAADESIDVLIIDSTDPVGPAEGLFKTDFLKRCHRILKSGGVMVQQSESPLYHSGSIIRELRNDMREAGFDSVATLPFPTL